jgi:hypothetical protein
MQIFFAICKFLWLLLLLLLLLFCRDGKDADGSFNELTNDIEKTILRYRTGRRYYKQIYLL